MYVAGKNFLTTQKKQLNSNSKAASPKQWKKDFPLGVGAPPPPPMALFFQTLLTMLSFFAIESYTWSQPKISFSCFFSFVLSGHRLLRVLTAN